MVVWFFEYSWTEAFSSDLVMDVWQGTFVIKNKS